MKSAAYLSGLSPMQATKSGVGSVFLWLRAASSTLLFGSDGLPGWRER
jgi:hypothetical protein